MEIAAKFEQERHGQGKLLRRRSQIEQTLDAAATHWAPTRVTLQPQRGRAVGAHDEVSTRKDGRRRRLTEAHDALARLRVGAEAIDLLEHERLRADLRLLLGDGQRARPAGSTDRAAADV